MSCYDGYVYYCTEENAACLYCENYTRPTSLRRQRPEPTQDRVLYSIDAAAVVRKLDFRQKKKNAAHRL